MPHQELEKRRINFNEVALGLTLELAMMEADRCLQCKKSPCVEGARSRS
jgi:glutamate synthase (NADPH/NADH) small chain